MILLDGRQFRSDQACGDVVLSVEPACPETADPTRTMLGSVQEQWLGEQLAATTATWPVIAQQTVLSDVTLPNGAVLNFDQWDGYPAARQRLLLQAAQAPRVVVLTGDIHLAAVGRLPGVGVEFVDHVDLLARDSCPPISPTSSPGSPTSSTPSSPTAATPATRSRRRRGRRSTAPSTTRPTPDSPVSTWKTFVVDAATRDAVTEI